MCAAHPLSVAASAGSLVTVAISDALVSVVIGGDAVGDSLMAALVADSAADLMDLTDSTDSAVVALTDLEVVALSVARLTGSAVVALSVVALNARNVLSAANSVVVKGQYLLVARTEIKYKYIKRKMKLIGECNTQLQPMSVRLSPYQADHYICATAENFGLKGRGSLVESHYVPIHFNDALFDACYYSHNQVITACGDGFLYTVRLNDQQVIRAPAGHVKECVSVDCNQQYIASAGWDGNILLFNRQLRLLRKYDKQHQTCHRISFHPTTDHIFMTSGGDALVKLNDCRSKSPVMTINTHGHIDVLSIDWNKYEQSIACGSADGIVRIFDIRTNTQLFQLRGHRRAVKQVQFSPFHADTIATASYDMTVVVWDWRSGVATSTYNGFTEFVSGLDWSVHRRDRLAVSCWDQTVRIFDI